MTFSIIGLDRQTNEIGIAVQSKMLAVGAVVPWIEANVGAVVTQSIVNTSYGKNALHLLKEGKTPTETIKLLTKNDELKQLRQVAIVNKNGEIATFTGNGCLPYSGEVTGENYSIQGNRLVDEQVIFAMEQTFKTSTGSLAERLLLSLEAGQAAGGDLHGQQAASLLVINNNERHDDAGSIVNLRVDDHKNPLKELQRLYNLYKLSFIPAKHDHIVPIKGEVKQKLYDQLIRHNVLQTDEKNITDIYDVLTAYLVENNFHARIQRNGFVDLDVLAYLQQN